MLRFQSDSLLEWLLRPFILVDPAAHVYHEHEAPDLRFAVLAIVVLVALFARRLPSRLQPGQGRALLTLALMFYVWAWVIGNGRYFIAGLLFVGPLLVAATRWLPGTPGLRAAVLLGVAVLQGVGIQMSYAPGRWGLVDWRDGPGLPIQASPLREQPAVFLTMSNITFSLLVPRFHPQSRWASIAGQVRVTPDRPEFKRIAAMLDGGLPIYLMLADGIHADGADPDAGRPDGEQKLFVEQVISPLGLALKDESCRRLRSPLKPGGLGQAKSDPEKPRGFWFCALQRTGPATGVSEPRFTPPETVTEVLKQLESRCARYFPPGSGNLYRTSGYWLKHYPLSDLVVYVQDDDLVLYRYYRALNPTVLGKADAVRRGEFTVDCDKPPGRYRFGANGLD